MLDAAGIDRALVFSNAYYFARSPTEGEGEYEKVKAENDWTRDQVWAFPSRLAAACSFNRLRASALPELERCARERSFKAVKLHFDASAVDLMNAAHVQNVREVLAGANRLRLAVIAQLQSEGGYGARQARTFLEELLPAASDVPVKICHLWGGGAFTEDSAAALAIYADAAAAKDPRMQNLWFDVAQMALAAPEEADPPDRRANAPDRPEPHPLRFRRPEWGGVPPRAHWADFVARMPLTPEELDGIAGNLAPHMR